MNEKSIMTRREIKILGWEVVDGFVVNTIPSFCLIYEFFFYITQDKENGLTFFFASHNAWVQCGWAFTKHT